MVVTSGRHYWRRGLLRAVSDTTGMLSRSQECASNRPPRCRRSPVQTCSGMEDKTLRRAPGQVSCLVRAMVIRCWVVGRREVRRRRVVLASSLPAPRRTCLEPSATSHSALGLAPLVTPPAHCSIAQRSPISPLHKGAHSHISTAPTAAPSGFGLCKPMEMQSARCQLHSSTAAVPVARKCAVDAASHLHRPQSPSCALRARPVVDSLAARLCEDSSSPPCSSGELVWLEPGPPAADAMHAVA